jgi:hypothetical protein
VIPNYKLDEFLKKYSISVDEVSWAKLFLEKGEENQSKESFLFMQAGVKFL